MKTYTIIYSLQGTGYANVYANSEGEAAEIMFTLSCDRLIDGADFYNSLEIESIKMLKPISAHSS